MAILLADKYVEAERIDISRYDDLTRQLRIKSKAEGQIPDPKNMAVLRKGTSAHEKIL